MIPTDHSRAEFDEDRGTASEPRERIDPDEPPEAPTRTGLAGFLERLGRLFQMHPRGPFGS